MIVRTLKALLLFFILGTCTLASAQSWPTAKPIRIVIAFGPGSASDIFARLVGEHLS